MGDRIRGKKPPPPPRTYLKNLATLLPAGGAACGAIILGLGYFFSMGLMCATLSVWCFAGFYSRKHDHPSELSVSFRRASALMAALTVFFLVLGLLSRYDKWELR